MTELLFRTEDLTAEEIGNLFVETELDRRAIDALKSRQPVVLVGSRGVGKSFLLKVAVSELKNEFEESAVLPVYVSLIKSSLLSTRMRRKDLKHGYYLVWQEQLFVVQRRLGFSTSHLPH